MGKRAKILNEIINARIMDIILPEPYTYDWTRLAESSRDDYNNISIMLDNGEIIEVHGTMKLSDE